MAARCLRPSYRCLHDPSRHGTTLQSTYDELHALAREAQIPTKVVVRNKLAAVAHHLEAFGDAALAAFALPKTYDDQLQNDLFVEVLGPKSFWFKRPTVIHLFPVTCPATVIEQSRASYRISYPLDMPTKSMVNMDNYRLEGRDYGKIQEIVLPLREEVHHQLQYNVVDIRDREQLCAAIDTTPRHLESIERTRRELANTIREYYPLEKMLS